MQACAQADFINQEPEAGTTSTFATIKQHCSELSIRLAQSGHTAHNTDCVLEARSQCSHAMSLPPGRKNSLLQAAAVMLPAKSVVWPAGHGSQVLVAASPPKPQVPASHRLQLVPEALPAKPGRQTAAGMQGISRWWRAADRHTRIKVLLTTAWRFWHSKTNPA